MQFIRPIAGSLIALAIGCLCASAQQTTPNTMPGCVYNLTPPSLSNGQIIPWQCDVNGKLITSSSGTAADIKVGTTTITSGTSTRVLYDNAGILGEYTISGTGSVAMTTSPTFVTPTLGVAAGTSLALGGCTIGTDGLCLTGTSTLNGNVVVNGASFGLSGSISAPAWTTAGIRYKNVTATLTDTTSSGTVAAARTDNFGGNTIAASSATTFTNYTSAYFSDPVQGSNVTFTNKWSLGADSARIGTSNQLTISTTGVLTATAPVFTTPTLGVASGTSLALGGATIGANVFAVTGNSNFSGTISTGGGVIVTAGNIVISSNVGVFGLRGSATLLSAPAAATLQFGNADVAAPVAQTLRVQSVVAPTADTAGAAMTIIGSLSTGSGASGDIIFQTGGTGAGSTAQNTATTAITIKGATQQVRLPQIASDAALTDTTVCQDTTNHGLYAGSGTAGVCLGNVSSARFKNNWTTLTGALAQVMALEPGTWNYKAEISDPTKLHYGFLAENYSDVLPRLTRYDSDGNPNGTDMMGLVPILVQAVKELKADNDSLRENIRRISR